MGKVRGEMASAMQWGLLCLCALLQATKGADVRELGAEVPPSAEETAFDATADSTNPTSLFPGPQYGLPGYKESHEWVDDYDIFSPLIFDAKYYALRYDLGDKSVGAIKADWKAFLANKDNAYPKDCRQANPLFSPQKYYRANPDIKENLEMNSNAMETCGSIVKEFVKSGLLDNAPRYDFNKEKAALAKDAEQIQSEELAIQIAKTSEGRRHLAWPIGQDFQSFGSEAMPSSDEYTLTFWYRTFGAREPECNVIHHGNNLHENNPRISQTAGGTNRLRFVVSQTNNNQFMCEPSQVLTEKKWTFISLVVEKQKVSVRYDGQEVCSKTNDGGSTLVLEGREFYASSPFQTPADAEIQKIQYYPNHKVQDSLIEYAMEQQEEQLEELK